MEVENAFFKNRRQVFMGRQERDGTAAAGTS